MAHFRAFTKQLKTALLSLSASKTLADAYGYTFDPAEDKDENDVSTQSMRPTQKLPDIYRMKYVRKTSYTFYPTPDDAAEAALLKKWVRYLRFMDSDAACGAFLLDLIKQFTPLSAGLLPHRNLEPISI